MKGSKMNIDEKRAANAAYGIARPELVKITIDSDVKRPVNYGQPRQPGQFFKSGCSVAPAGPKFRQRSPRYMRFMPKPTVGEHMMIFNKRLHTITAKAGKQGVVGSRGADGDVTESGGFVMA